MINLFGRPLETFEKKLSNQKFEVFPDLESAKTGFSIFEFGNRNDFLIEIEGTNSPCAQQG